MNRRLLNGLKPLSWIVIFAVTALNMVVKLSLIGGITNENLQSNPIESDLQIAYRYNVLEHSKLNQQTQQPHVDSWGKRIDRFNEDSNATFIEWQPYFSLSSYLRETARPELIASLTDHWIEVWPKCNDYFSPNYRTKFAYPYFYGNCKKLPQQPNPTDSTSITLVLQMSSEWSHWDQLQETVKHWHSAISVGYYVAVREDPDDVSGALHAYDVRDQLEDKFYEYELQSADVCVHLIVEYLSDEEPSLYPVNSVRNIATAYTDAAYILHIDSYFVPMPGLAKYIQQQFEALSWNTSNKAFVIPAYSSIKKLKPFPKVDVDIVKLWHQNVLSPWQEQLSSATSQIYTSVKLSSADILKVYYDPFYVVEKAKLPFYPEEMVFGRHDKVIHSILLNKTGYEFQLLSKSFVIREPHNNDNQREVLNKAQQRCADIAFNNLQRGVRERERRLAAEEEERRERAHRHDKRRRDRLEGKKKSVQLFGGARSHLAQRNARIIMSGQKVKLQHPYKPVNPLSDDDAPTFNSTLSKLAKAQLKAVYSLEHWWALDIEESGLVQAQRLMKESMLLEQAFYNSSQLAEGAVNKSASMEYDDT